MPETTKAPTEEMRKTASWCVQNMLPDSEQARAKGIEARIAVALVAQDALAVERCAKWHDEQAAACDPWDLPISKGHHIRSAAALRAQGEK